VTPDLRTRYLGLQLRSPLVASASPLTGELDGLRRLEDAGAGAAVLPSLFEEQLTHDQLELDRLLETTAEHVGEAQSYFPELDDYNTGPWSYLQGIERAKQAVAIPVIASLNGVTPGGWVRHAKRMQDAGADALELNLYAVAADPRFGAAELEARYLELVAAVRAAVTVPLAVKLSPFFTALANLAVRMVDAGADGLVLFNRFYTSRTWTSTPWRPSPGWCCRPPRSCACRCAGSPSSAAISAAPRWRRPLASTPGWTPPRCCWPARTWR
jgi:dihydroorotate dehydrogenase (fumarate)